MTNGKQGQRKKTPPPKNKVGYTSPLEDELGLPVQPIGQGVFLHHDKENGRVLLDIDVETRRGLSISRKNIKIATGSYNVTDTQKLSINTYDKEMSDEELDVLAVTLKRDKKKKELEKERKALE
jgi:hypothetical protein